MALAPEATRLGRRHRRQPGRPGVRAGRPRPVRRGTRQVTRAVFELVYPDGAVRRRDAAGASRSGRLFVVGKSLFGGASTPRRPSSRTTGRTGCGSWVRVLPIATDGAFFPDGQHLVLRGYGRAVSTPPRPRAGRRAPAAGPAAGRGHRRGDDSDRLRQLGGRRGRRCSRSAAADLARIVAPDRPRHLRPRRPRRRRRRDRDGEETRRRTTPGPRDPWQLGDGWRRLVRGCAIVAAVFAHPHASAAMPGCGVPRLTSGAGAGGGPAWLRLPRRARRAARRGRRPAGQGAGHPAGLGGRVDLPAPQRTPAGGRHRRRRAAPVPLPPGLAGRRDSEKYRRVLGFGRALSRARERVLTDLGTSGMSCERACARRRTPARPRLLPDRQRRVRRQARQLRAHHAGASPRPPAR